MNFFLCGPKFPPKFELDQFIDCTESSSALLRLRLGFTDKVNLELPTIMIAGISTVILETIKESEGRIQTHEHRSDKTIECY